MNIKLKHKQQPILTNTLKASTLFLIYLLLLSACSSTPDIPENAVHFHTRITSSGLKHFQLTAIIAPPTRRQSQAASTNRRSPEERMARKAEKLLKALAEQKIIETQFCREGYWFLGDNFYGRKVYLRGECNDVATEEDRIKFPDTLKYW